MDRNILVKREILKEMRNRLFQAGIIVPEQIQTENERFDKPEDGVYLRESFNGGSFSIFTNVSRRQFSAVNYEVFCRNGFGSDKADEILKKIVGEFLTEDGFDSVVCCNGTVHGVIREIEEASGGTAPDDPGWYRQRLSITMEIYLPQMPVD